MRKIQVLSGLAVLAAAITAGPSAQAGFGSWGSHGSSGGDSYGSSGGSSGGASVGYASHGSSGGYGSSGGFASSGGSSGVGHVGPIRRLISRMHEHRAAKAARRSAFHSGGGSYGSSGGASYGSSGGASYGSSGHVAAPVIYGGGSSGGSSGGHYSSSSHSQYHDVPVYSYSKPVEPTHYAAAQATTSVDSDTAILTVSVPETAVVRVNGLPTKSAGSIRQFMSSGLEAGFVYKYEIEVQFEGVEAPETHVVKLRAGSAERVVFNGPSTASDIAEKSLEMPETVVTVHVPADSKVELAGNETKGEGETRTFRTRRLAAGEAWESYTVRVTANINGSAVTKEKTMRLEAGSVHDLAFDFDVTEVASR